MTLGEKIKKARFEKKLTQSELCKNTITRNMLSAIESGKANPSIESLRHIADGLSLPLSYLLSDDDDLFYYKKKERIGDIKRLYEDKKYKSCIEKVMSIDGLDDELSYILALCYFELGKAAVNGGSLYSGKKYLAAFYDYSEKTVYDTARQKHSALLYSALAANIQSPLLELDTKAFEKSIGEDYEYDFYKYLMADKTYNHTNQQFKDHLYAKELIRDRKFKDALKILLSILENKSNLSAYLIFSLYGDIEMCYKQLLDFENAYKYSSKRFTIIEGFKL